MKPLAKLYLNRQRLYDKTCEVVSETSGEASSMEPRKKSRKYRFVLFFSLVCHWLFVCNWFFEETFAGDFLTIIDCIASWRRHYLFNVAKIEKQRIAALDYVIKYTFDQIKRLF